MLAELFCYRISSKSWRSVSYIWFDRKIRITTFVYVTRTVHHKLTFTPSGCSSFINKMLTHCQKYKRRPVMVFDSFIHQLVSEYKIYKNNIWSEFCRMCRRLGNNSVLYNSLARTYVPYWLRNINVRLSHHVYMNKAVRVWHPAEVRPLLLFLLYSQAQVIFKILR